MSQAFESFCLVLVASQTSREGSIIRGRSRLALSCTRDPSYRDTQQPRFSREVGESNSTKGSTHMKSTQLGARQDAGATVTIIQTPPHEGIRSRRPEWETSFPLAQQGEIEVGYVYDDGPDAVEPTPVFIVRLSPALWRNAVLPAIHAGLAVA
ncbi:hypothetical protein CONPUDRAFT_82454 [Coniophora puteana RWD-64-598 SS2]|uniref:Uncharacterized protein n=1 Tax=Coniophora puteana (strain RWD-64-598) TaxID=741705 RepID=A0A5M3MR87_CONPW|nr:uncharacterized protein CONPUDRAFT_82454 [Coniophora puteana RWD-64-598 SS2]EIW81586.1 hypothetical protein CONPUDRAFT_82454 [Coniophora puteana RWD-64-598 SS2]